MSRSRGERLVTTRSPIEISPSRDLLEPGDHAQQRRLAAAGRADEHHELAARDREADVVDREHAAGVVLRHPLEPDLGHSLSLLGVRVLDRGRDRMASSRSCKRSQKSFSEISYSEPRPGDTEAAPTITTVARLANVSVASASRALNGIRTTAGHPRAGDRGGRGDRLRAERRGALAPLAAHGPDRVRDARRGEPGLHVDGQLDPGVAARPAAADAALDRRGRGRRARDAARPQAALRRRADPLLAAHHRGARGRARARGGARDRDRHAAEGHARRHGAARSRARGAADAVRHLHEVGRRRIAFVNGPQQTVPGTARRLGYLDGLRSCGLERDDDLCAVADDFMVEPGPRAPPSGCSSGRGPTRSSAPTTCSPSARSRRCAMRTRRAAATSRSWAWTTPSLCGAHLAGADHDRPRLGRARADRGRAALRAGSRTRRGRRSRSASSRGSSSAPPPGRA